MYIYMYIHIFVCKYMYIYMCTQKKMYTYIFTCILALTFIRKHVFCDLVYVCMFACGCICVRVGLCLRENISRPLKMSLFNTALLQKRRIILRSTLTVSHMCQYMYCPPPATQCQICIIPYF